MTRELDLDAINRVVLDPERFDCAVEAATQAFTAGGGEAEQLEAGIRAYLWASQPRPDVKRYYPGKDAYVVWQDNSWVMAGGPWGNGKPPTEKAEYPFELPETLGEILGMPNFQCGPIAHLMRDAGATIARRAEAEQAYVLHWFTNLWIEHGENWRKVAGEKMKEAHDKIRAEKAAK